MRIINKIKYRDVFIITKCITVWKDKICFICQKEIKIKESYYVDYWNQIKSSNTKYSIWPIHICIKCGKTAKKAEDTIIPLLKILYGGEVTVRRNIYKKYNYYAIFKY